MTGLTEISMATADVTAHQKTAGSVEDKPMSVHQLRGGRSRINARKPDHMFAQDTGRTAGIIRPNAR
ncbi:hypothetical protein ACVSQB_19685 [Bradyrhizobium elkanii]|uniref:hypothetical protein n=1 Tax=Bradyrhizobium elkanii TaxID=29448 RepID=UPI00114C8B6A|nr:hypothetical protein [Bradyrhizobium elkanii]